MKKIGTLLAIVCCAYLKAQVCFAPLASYSVGSTPVNVTSADFNNDGIPDLATTNFYSNNVSILLATGTGSFSTATNFTVNSTPSCVISADFDGDGKNDLAVTNGTGGSSYVSILLGTGTGSFGSATNFSVGLGPCALVSGDFNGDSKIDLAVCNGASGSTGHLSVLLGTGTGSFAAAVNYLTGIGVAGPAAIISADFN